jgi:hypothetical protein
VVQNPKDEHENFIVNGKKDRVVGVMTTYISREIFFHASRINYQNQATKKSTTLFNKINKSHIMQIEQEI